MAEQDVCESEITNILKKVV